MRAAVACVALGLAVFTTGCEKKTEKEQAPPQAAPAEAPDHATIAEVEIPEIRVRPTGPTTVHVSWLTPHGTTINDEAPFRVRWNRSDGLADAPSDVKATGSTVKDGFRITVEPMPGAPNATLDGEVSVVVCDDVTHSVCVPVKRKLQLGFMAVPDAAAEATVSIPLPAAKS